MAHRLLSHAGDMARDQQIDPVSDSPPTSNLYDQALARLRRSGAVAGRAALAGGVFLQLPTMAACVEDPSFTQAEQESWAQYEGQRNTDLVSFTGGYWSECKQPNTRFGCGSYDLYVKVRVRPVAGADLSWKRVGVVYKTPYDTTERTALGHYFTTWSNGDEEWHVPVNVPSWSNLIVFDAWYQDGAGGTWYDDNQGELHVVNAGPAYNVVRVEPWLTTLTVDDYGVRGRISIQVADLDYDKRVKLVATKDDWNTVIELGTGVAGELNKFHWVEDFPWSNSHERWAIDLDLPGATDELQYAIVYEHGVVNGARTYAFWDNNFGTNYRAYPTPDVD